MTRFVRQPGRPAATHPTWRSVTRAAGAFVALVVVGVATVVLACNVPVFRYALERWRPDAYRVTVVHRGPLDDAAKKLLAEIDDQVEAGALNVAVRVVDVAKPVDSDKSAEGDKSAEEETAAELAALKTFLGESATPKMLLQYPAYLRIAVPIASAEFNAATVKQTMTSPVRQQLVQRLTEGQTAIWLLLESGDKEKDDAAAKVITERLTQLEKELKLPELTNDSADRLFSNVPLQVSFSLLRLSRSPEERTLMELLLRSEDDLAERPDPMVFPVFGRGRALLPLVGAGITPDNVRDSAGFLVGACSCEVKELNPGFDLLLAAKWEELLGQDGVPPPPVPAALTNSNPNAPPELVPIPGGSKRVDAPVESDTKEPAAAGGVAIDSTAPIAATPVPQLATAPFQRRLFLLLGVAVVAITAAALVAARIMRSE